MKKKDIVTHPHYTQIEDTLQDMYGKVPDFEIAGFIQRFLGIPITVKDVKSLLCNNKVKNRYKIQSNAKKNLQDGKGRGRRSAPLTKRSYELAIANKERFEREGFDANVDLPRDRGRPLYCGCVNRELCHCSSRR